MYKDKVHGAYTIMTHKNSQVLGKSTDWQTIRICCCDNNLSSNKQQHLREYTTIIILQTCRCLYNVHFIAL